ncbi:hypothetical protein A4G19_07350 [Pasteurellaceae bacterium Macca]|nr:hypothetical protein [Pasteurellaceae bacterium Macca]
MKNIVKFGYTALACLVLTACGSSGGGSSDSTAKNTTATPSKPTVSTPSNNSSSTNKPTAQPSQPAKPTHQAPVTENKPTAQPTVTAPSNKTGGVVVNSTVKNLTESENPNIILVDGKTIRVGYEDVGIHAYAFGRFNGSAYCCGQYSAMRFGALDTKDGNSYVFYNGLPSQNVPTSGTANYSGHSIIKAGAGSDWVEGTSQFQVDFGAKTLKGSLTSEQASTVDIKAQISGNDFAGSASSKAFSSAKVEGKFYGPNAAELGGLFKDDKNSWSGAFGAKR